MTLKQEKMKHRVILLLFIVSFLSACTWPDYVGKYHSTNCNMLEKVEIYPDNTMDLRYYGMDFSINRPIRVKDNIITVYNRDTEAVEYEFKFERGKLYEKSGMDLNCIMEKDTL